jgi:small conductance mechanosensitive channel
MEWLTTLAENQDKYLNEYVIPWSINILMALVIFVIGRWIAKGVTKALERLMRKTNVDETLVDFIGNLSYAALLIVVIIAALDRLGVNTTSVLAVFAAAGLAVGLALKDSLTNFAAGVMLILFKPFKAGDYVEAGGIGGIVESIRVFSTRMRTPDNREITLPNGQIYSGIITNYSARETRRIDLIMGIGYGDDIRLAKKLIQDVLAGEARILEDPAPAIMVAELADSSVNLAVRPWVNSADYWDVRSDLLENIKAAFDNNGISIPFPQRDVHVYQESSGAGSGEAFKVA